MNIMKRDKEDVDYSRGHKDSHCGPWTDDDTFFCEHFRKSYGGTCIKVKGEIDKGFWCKLYQKKR